MHREAWGSAHTLSTVGPHIIYIVGPGGPSGQLRFKVQRGPGDLAFRMGFKTQEPWGPSGQLTISMQRGLGTLTL